MCVCFGGFFNIKGQCGQCPPYSVYNKANLQCDCISGYTFNSGSCIPITTMPTMNPLAPVKISECTDPNAFYLAGQGCVCVTSYHLIDSICQQCPLNTFYDPSLAICRIACNAYESFNPITGACDCAPLYYRTNGTCLKCPGNSTFNTQAGSCTCPQGVRQTAAGLCVVGCGVNEILSNGVCCCI